ncbi:MAG: hypothetical protein EA376_08615 [Phycisphaeraceae bacterium]|nr:MAG: hypothetical protein EA376_08615 [Phycisphaeraceae bacterium]
MRTIFNQGSSGSGGVSLLPEDYVEKKADRRANFIYLTLFSIVIFGVVAAFFVTNQRWTTVKRHQEAINARYTQAAKDIEQLKVLETQKQQMLAKAELTTSLIEKTPRSLLLADLINRMPQKLTLLELELVSKRIEPPRTPQSNQRQGARSLAGQRAQETESAITRAPRYDSTLTVIGVAATHNAVAHYVATLQNSPLLDRVELRYSEVTIINDRGLNKFRIEARLRPNADARQIKPIAEGATNAFGAGVKPGVHESKSTASAADEQEN